MNVALRLRLTTLYRQCLGFATLTKLPLALTQNVSRMLVLTGLTWLCECGMRSRCENKTTVWLQDMEGSHTSTHSSGSPSPKAQGKAASGQGYIRTGLHQDRASPGQGFTRTGLHQDRAASGQGFTRTRLHQDRAASGQGCIRTTLSDLNKDQTLVQILYKIFKITWVFAWVYLEWQLNGVCSSRTFLLVH